MQLSVLIPCFNEIATIAEILRQVRAALPSVEKEIIIVDDCSTDGTREWLMHEFGVNDAVTGHALRVTGASLPHSEGKGDPTTSVSLIFHDKNQGKGAALRSALTAATGEVVVIQDADLEYDPQDWREMYDLIYKNRADVVYGSRFFGRPHRSLYFHHYAANRLISILFNIVHNQILSDIETCYKMFRKSSIDQYKLVSNDFGIEIELSSIFSKQRKLRIFEIGISYYGRTVDEGKKISWKDGLMALVYIFKFRFFR